MIIARRATAPQNRGASVGSAAAGFAGVVNTSSERDRVQVAGHEPRGGLDVHRVANAELSVGVVPPADHLAAAHQAASVEPAGGDGDGLAACQHQSEG